MKIHKQYSLTQEKLFEMAKPEMDAILQHFSLPAIAEVLENEIDGGSVSSCIYGRLTGNCDSEEARKFIQEHITHLIEMDNEVGNFKTYIKKLSVKEAFKKEFNRAVYYETPLEQYIFPTDYEQEVQENEEKWPESYNERIERVKTYIKSKINETIS